jgi:hypothetical protein
MPFGANSFLVYSQSQGGKAVMRFVGTSANVIVQANSTVNSDIADSNHANDAILAADICGVFFSITGNTATVARGGNTILTLSGSDHWTRSMGWITEAEYNTANIVVTFGTGALGVIFLEVTKEYTGGTP